MGAEPHLEDVRSLLQDSRTTAIVERVRERGGKAYYTDLRKLVEEGEMSLSTLTKRLKALVKSGVLLERGKKKSKANPTWYEENPEVAVEIGMRAPQTMAAALAKAEKKAAPYLSKPEYRRAISQSLIERGSERLLELLVEGLRKALSKESKEEGLKVLAYTSYFVLQEYYIELFERLWEYERGAESGKERQSSSRGAH